MEKRKVAENAVWRSRKIDQMSQLRIPVRRIMEKKIRKMHRKLSEGRSDGGVVISGVSVRWWYRIPYPYVVQGVGDLEDGQGIMSAILARSLLRFHQVVQPNPKMRWCHQRRNPLRSLAWC